MTRTTWTAAVASLACAAFSAISNASAATTQQWVPSSRSVTELVGHPPRKTFWTVFESGRDGPWRTQIEAFRSTLQALGVQLREPSSEVPGPEAAAPGSTQIVFVLDPRLHPEGFKLHTAGDRVVVIASSTTGVAHATATLLQMIRVHGDGTASIPAVLIQDHPDHPFRSFMVDMGRNPHSPQTLRHVVDMMWLCRANFLQLHLTDDQLFSWPSEAFPKLQSARAGWTLDDFRELEAYSQARGVTIIPELDVPGHSTILRREYPEVFGKNTTELATLPSATRGIETLLDEMLGVFRATPYVHVGGDEAYGVPEDDQRDLINRLNRFLHARGKTTLVWEGPRLGTGEHKVDESVVHINWRTINFPAQQMLDAGYQVVHAPWDPLYIVDHYPRTMFTAVDLERCYAWDPTRFAHINHEISTFAEPHRTRSAEGILGFCMPWWEGREANLIPLCLPRLATVASAAWNRDGETDFLGFRERLTKFTTRFEAISGFEMPTMPTAAPDPATSSATNLAFGGKVSASSGRHQPVFGPQRLTNGIPDRFDHFLGYPTTPEPLVIDITLAKSAPCSRVVVHETAVGNSHELYELLVSADGSEFVAVGSTTPQSRGDQTFVAHVFESTTVHTIRIRTRGCHGLTFPSFSRLTEVEAFTK